MQFQEWFDTKLFISKFPTIDEARDIIAKYDFIINVFECKNYTDSTKYNYYERLSSQLKDRAFHFPITGIYCHDTMSILEGVLRKLNELFDQEKSVFLHCRSGLHRSVCIKEAFHFMHTGKHFFSNTDNILLLNCNSIYNMFPVNQDQMESFLKKLGEDFHSKQN